MGLVLAFKRPDKDYPLPGAGGSETDIRRLRDPAYRDYNPSAIEASERFRRIFEGPFHTRLRLERRRDHINLVQLLLGQRLAESICDAEAFIADILGKTLYLTPTHKRYFSLERTPRKGIAYRLQYYSF
jgi:hypothetical protein